ncbi:MAG: hypothetical protein JXB10_00730 [Pirellulales bacterium]|nr:hypothetical protein [Pirellulales bacterium]
MFRWTCNWLCLLPAVMLVLAIAGTARGLERLPPVETEAVGPTSPAPAVAPPTENVAHVAYVSGLEAGGNPALEARLAELEKTLKKMKDKEEADKKKAASAPSVKPFGKIHWDTAAFNQNPASVQQAGPFLDGTGFRRARIGLKGEAFNVFEYKIEMDFAGQTSFKDVFVAVKELPYLGIIRIGHFKECFGLEILNSDDFTTFMERSLIDGGERFGHIGDRNPGIMTYNWNESETMTWAAGAFVDVAGEKPPTFPKGTIYDDDGGVAADARFTWLPWVADYGEFKNRGLLHTGIAGTYRQIPDLSPTAPAGSVRYSLGALPECYWANNVAYTGPLNDTEHVVALRPELALVYGPFSMQTEYEWVWLSRSEHADPTFDGGYVSFSYVLTGENRQYDRQRGEFKGITPFENFFRVRAEDGGIYTGRGAWEVAYRISYLNLTDAGVRGGRVTDHTLGLNWYLSPATRMMFNYVHSEATDRGEYARGIAEIFETRLIMMF